MAFMAREENAQNNSGYLMYFYVVRGLLKTGEVLKKKLLKDFQKKYGTSLTVSKVINL
jgi:hypothetical protein